MLGVNFFPAACWLLELSMSFILAQVFSNFIALLLQSTLLAYFTAKRPCSNWPSTGLASEEDGSD
jgi:hypothetical protein